MNKAQLIQAVLQEMERVWGPEGFGGESEEYAWLQSRYGISEEEDVQWQLILQYEIDDLPEEDWEEEEIMQFLEDNFAVVLFLEGLLRKYRRSTETFHVKIKPPRA